MDHASKGWWDLSPCVSPEVNPAASLHYPIQGNKKAAFAVLQHQNWPITLQVSEGPWGSSVS